MKKKIITAFLAIICFEIGIFSILINIAWRLECINAMQKTNAVFNGNMVAFLEEHNLILFSTLGTIFFTILLMLNYLKK